MDFRLEDISALTASEIDGFLLEQQHTLLYQSHAYLTMLGEYLGCEIKCVVAREEGHVFGFFPLAFSKNDDKTICNSLPYYGSNSGITVKAGSLEKRNMIREQIYALAKTYILERNCASFTVITNPLDSEGDAWMRENAEYDLVDERIGQITHFPVNAGAGELVDRFEDPRPRNIRKAIKEGVEVHATNSEEDLDFLYSVHRENILAIGGIPKEERFFREIPAHFNNDQFKVYVASINGTKVAALLVFYFNRTVEYFTPAIVGEYRNMQPAALIIYTAMKDAMLAGFKNWNWGGTWLSQGGVYEFKKKWGTTDYRYYYYVRLFDDSLSQKSKEYFTSTFPNFYVLPFGALTN